MKVSQEETKSPKKSKKGKNKKSTALTKAITEPPKKEPFLDVDKDLEIGDNFSIEALLKGDELTQWNDSKDVDDHEDLTESNLKKLEKKFQYCHKDLLKKRHTNLINEPSLISLETIVQNHPALKFLDHDLVVSILKHRDIEKFKIKKQIITKKDAADKIYFVLFGVVKLTEQANTGEYYGIIKTGWPIGEELFIDGQTAYTDTAQAGSEVGLIYITLEEMKKVLKGTAPDSFERFQKRLKKYAFLKKIMRKENLNKSF